MLDLYKNIKQRRIELGMTQSELAEKTGYADKSAIARIESGRTDLGGSKITIFAKALDVTPAWLMGWEPDNGYYYDNEVAQLAQEIKDNPGQRVLLDASRNLSKEDMEKIIKMVNIFVNDNNGND